MKDAVLLILGAVVGGFFGLWLSVYYQAPWTARRARRRRLRASREFKRVRMDGSDQIRIAGHATDVHLIEGDGQTALEPENVSIDLRSKQTVLPPIVGAARKRITRQLQPAGQQANAMSSWNSSCLVALNRYFLSRTALREDSTLRLDMSPVDYATFAATVLGLDVSLSLRDELTGDQVSTTLRQQFFPNRSSVLEAVRHPIPFLANGVGVLLLAFTDDNEVILTRRGPQSRARPGQRDVSVVEGIHTEHDSKGTGKLSPYQTAVRGCREELGVTVKDEDVRLLAFAVDMNYYQWSFLGLVHLRHTAEEVMALHALHAKDRWEGKLEPVDAEPRRLFERLRQDNIWDLGLVTTYLALTHQFGVKPVRQAAYRVFGPTEGRRP